MPDLPPSYVDVNGVFIVQKNLIGNLAGNSDPKSQSIVKSVSDNLNQIYKDFDQSNLSSTGILEKQDDMLKIINKENARITNKKAEIDNAYTGKQRAVQLNESYRQKYQQMMKIILVIIVTLILFIFITFLSSRFPMVPSFVFEILSIAVISTGLFIVYFMTINMLKRSPTYFDQLYLQSPGIGGNTVTSKAATAPNLQDLLGGANFNMCAGSSCCDVGTRWDTGNARCIGNGVALFSTIQQSYNLGDFNGRVSVMPNSPNEFDGYTPV